MVTSSWPTLWSLPVVGYAWILLAVRLTRFRATLLDHRGNLALAVLVIASTMREPTLQRGLVTLSAGYLSDAWLFQLAIILMGAVVGFNVLVLADALGLRYRPAVVHGIAVGSALIALLCGTGARHHGVAIADETGWAPVGFWLALLPPMVWLDSLVIRLGIAQLRQRPERREVLAYAALALFPAVHLLGFSCAPIAAVFLVRGEHNVFTALLAAADRDILLYQLVIIVVGMTVPLLLRLAQRLGLDAASRSRKRLLPLWSDLTAVCPELVYRGPAGDLGSRFLLHRTVIEIRDCLRILSRYAPEPASLTGDAHAVQDYAIQLAHACAAKSAGAPASGAVLALPSTAGDVDAEIAELTTLAAHWHKARTVADLPSASRA